MSSVHKGKYGRQSSGGKRRRVRARGGKKQGEETCGVRSARATWEVLGDMGAASAPPGTDQEVWLVEVL